MACRLNRHHDLRSWDSVDAMAALVARPILWVGSAREDVRTRSTWSNTSCTRPIGSPMPLVGSGIREIRVHTKLKHRVIYIAKFAEGVYVLHAFQKRTRRTARADIELARSRLKDVQGIEKADDLHEKEPESDRCHRVCLDEIHVHQHPCLREHRRRSRAAQAAQSAHRLARVREEEDRRHQRQNAQRVPRLRRDAHRRRHPLARGRRRRGPLGDRRAGGQRPRPSPRLPARRAHGAGRQRARLSRSVGRPLPPPPRLLLPLRVLRARRGRHGVQRHGDGDAPGGPHHQVAQARARLRGRAPTERPGRRCSRCRSSNHR